MIILLCSTWRGCGGGHREKHFEMITAPDRWMTSAAPSLSMNLCGFSGSVYVCICVYGLVCSV